MQRDGLKGVEKALHGNTDLKQEQIVFMLKGFEMAMESNYFWYQDDYYVQTKGVAMGAHYAPSAANLFTINHN